MSDVKLCEATPFFLQSLGYNSQALPGSQMMTRWQEAENRLHIMLDILAYIPVRGIEIRFLNFQRVLSIPRIGKDPDAFRHEAHTLVRHTFSGIEVKYKTPTFRTLSQAFEAANRLEDPTMIYLLTDGLPSDASTETVAALIISRPRPAHMPVTLISCSDVDDEVEWMKQVHSFDFTVLYVCNIPLYYIWAFLLIILRSYCGICWGVMIVVGV